MRYLKWILKLIRWFCYAGLLNDVPLEYMRILLGHSNISVTREWYAHFDKSKINSYATKVNANRTRILKKNWRKKCGSSLKKCDNLLTFSI